MRQRPGAAWVLRSLDAHPRGPKSAERALIETYTLNPNGCWRPPPIGEELERHQFEHVLEMRAERIEKLERAGC